MLYNKHLETSKFLIEAGANINAKDRFGNTALMFASSKEVVECLESKGAEE